MPSRKLWRSSLPLAVGMDIAPLIDIVFQQMIFFMLTSAFVFQPGMKVHLPKAVTAEVAQKENLVITISKGGHLYLESQVVTLQELKGRLSTQEGKRRSLLIRSDRETPMGRVVEVWDLCRSLGITQVHIATSSEGS